MKKLISLLAVFTFMLVGCTSEQDTITVSGSTSVEDYFSTISKEYEALTGTIIEYQAIGSSAGIENANNGVTSFGTSSRALEEEEIAYGMETHIIAYDGISVIVHEDNPVDDLTVDQVHDIYTGEITNWSEVGGTDEEIVVVSREDGSGTRGSFEDTVGLEEGDLTEDAMISEGNGNVASTVASNPNAIGYVSFKTLGDNEDKINGVAIDGVEPKEENVVNNTYPLMLPFSISYHPENLSETEQEFITWLLEEGRYYLPETMGLISPSKEEY